MDQVTNISWTHDGARSFEEIVEYIAMDSPFYASNFARKILESVERLRSFPRIGRIVPEYENELVRELIFQNYRIVYTLNEETAYVLLIIHGSRELPQQL